MLADLQRLLLPTHFQPQPGTDAVRSRPRNSPNPFAVRGRLRSQARSSSATSSPHPFQPLPCTHAVRNHPCTSPHPLPVRSRPRSQARSSPAAASPHPFPPTQSHPRRPQPFVEFSAAIARLQPSAQPSSLISSGFFSPFPATPLHQARSSPAASSPHPFPHHQRVLPSTHFQPVSCIHAIRSRPRNSPHPWSRLVVKHKSLWLLNVLLAFVWGCWISWILSAWTDWFGLLAFCASGCLFGQMSLTHFLDLSWWVGAWKMYFLYPFFFRPSPSRLSPGRNTVFVPLNELCKVLYIPALGSRKRAWTSTQSQVVQTGVTNEEKDQQTEQQKTNKKTQKKTTKTAKTKKHPVRWTCSVKDGSLCAGELKRSCQKQSHNQPDITARSRRRCKTKQQIGSAETQDPPSQDPGDRTVKPRENSTFNRIWRTCNELGCNPAASILPWEAIQKTIKTAWEEELGETKWNNTTPLRFLSGELHQHGKLGRCMILDCRHQAFFNGPKQAKWCTCPLNWSKSDAPERDDLSHRGMQSLDHCRQLTCSFFLLQRLDSSR